MDDKERAEKRANYKKKLLTKAQREQVADLVAQGVPPSLACQSVGRDACFLIHTRKEFPEWHKELMQLITSRVEEHLAKIVEGKVTKKKIVRMAVFKDGEPVLNPDGSPVMKVVKEEEEPVIPSQGQQQLWLAAHAPEVYGPKAADAPATMGEDVDPETLAADLAQRFPEEGETAVIPTIDLDAE